MGTLAGEVDGGASSLIHEYFAHRIDVVAVERGNNGWFPVRMPATATLPTKTKMQFHEAVDLHLEGKMTLGFYTTRAEDDTVKWVCWDIDSLDPDQVYRITGLLDGPYIVEHTGGRGRHVWQFFNEATPASQARAYGNWIKANAGADCEVFPKQDSVGGGLGNLVRVPFGVNNKTGNRSRVEFGTWGKIDCPLVDAGAPEAGSKLAGGTPIPGSYGEWIADLYNDGDTETKGGRNNTLHTLAWWMRMKGFPVEVVDFAVQYANDECLAEPLDAAELDKVLRR